jgi:hypothetical protein
MEMGNLYMHCIFMRFKAVSTHSNAFLRNICGIMGVKNESEYENQIRENSPTSNEQKNGG